MTEEKPIIKDEVELMNIPRPFHELSDKECRMAYWKLYNDLLKKQIAYTDAKTEFDCIRHVCINKGLRIKKGRKWVWNEDRFQQE